MQNITPEEVHVKGRDHIERHKARKIQGPGLLSDNNPLSRELTQVTQEISFNPF
jgi:hypothetical protein